MSERKFLVLSIGVNLLATFHIVLVQSVNMYQVQRSLIHAGFVALTLGLMLMVLMIAFRFYVVSRKESDPKNPFVYPFNILSSIVINATLIYFNLIIFFNHINTLLRYFIAS